MLMIRSLAIVLAAFVCCCTAARAQDEASGEVCPVAILPFQERGPEAAGLGTQASDLLFAALVVKPDLYLVEREDISKVLEESEMSLSGAVSDETAVQAGKLTGARVMVTGSVIVTGSNLVLVAKIIGTETSRVLGASVKGKVDDDLTEMTEKLGDAIAEKVSKESEKLIAKTVTKEDRIKSLSEKLGDAARPSVWISIEERHVGQAVIDPAAETELTMLCKELGFKVIDHDKGKKEDAEILLTGEGFSQFAARRGNLQSVKARLEIKAVKRESGEVLLADRQLAVALDLAEQIAGKSALQNAADSIAERVIPKLVTRR